MRNWEFYLDVLQCFPSFGLNFCKKSCYHRFQYHSLSHSDAQWKASRIKTRRRVYTGIR